MFKIGKLAAPVFLIKNILREISNNQSPFTLVDRKKSTTMLVLFFHKYTTMYIYTPLYCTFDTFFESISSQKILANRDC